MRPHPVLRQSSGELELVDLNSLRLRLQHPDKLQRLKILKKGDVEISKQEFVDTLKDIDFSTLEATQLWEAIDVDGSPSVRWGNFLLYIAPESLTRPKGVVATLRSRVVELLSENRALEENVEQLKHDLASRNVYIQGILSRNEIQAEELKILRPTFADPKPSHGEEVVAARLAAPEAAAETSKVWAEAGARGHDLLQQQMAHKAAALELTELQAELAKLKSQNENLVENNRKLKAENKASISALELELTEALAASARSRDLASELAREMFDIKRGEEERLKKGALKNLEIASTVAALSKQYQRAQAHLERDIETWKSKAAAAARCVNRQEQELLLLRADLDSYRSCGKEFDESNRKENEFLRGEVRRLRNTLDRFSNMALSSHVLTAYKSEYAGGVPIYGGTRRVRQA